MKKRYTISVFTEDVVGILNRVTIIFTRRKINIDRGIFLGFIFIYLLGIIMLHVTFVALCPKRGTKESKAMQMKA